MAEDEMLIPRNGFIVDEHVISNLIIGENDDISKPLVSIVIPTYKRPELLKKSIESALSQNANVEIEVVVVDNNTDIEESYLVNDCISNFDVKNLKLYRNEKNIGLYGNWNRCLQLAKGRWVTLLNDDDLFDPGFLSACLNVVKNKPDISAVCCKTRLLDECRQERDIPFYRKFVQKTRGYIEQDETGEVKKLRPVDYFMSNQHCGSLGVLMKRSKAIKLGGFYAEYFPVSDFAFFIRFSLEYGMYILDEKHVNYRIHESENLKNETIIKSVRLSYILRQNLARHTGLPFFISNLYSRLYAVNMPKSLSLALGAKCDVGLILYEAGFKNRSVYIQLAITYFFIKYVFSPNIK